MMPARHSLLARICSLIALIPVAMGYLPTRVERAQMLEVHLEARETVYPPASDMLLMEYSPDLERLADSWAQRCQFVLPDTKVYPQYRGLIQNLALVAGVRAPFTEAACAWLLEKKYYNYHNNSCTHVCGHYTQMVWADTTHVGCAMHQCDGLKPEWGNPQYLTVCHYKPGGNYPGVRPYQSGPICSKCPEGHECYRNQCVKDPVCKKVFPTMGFRFEDRTVPECVKHVHTVLLAFDQHRLGRDAYESACIGEDEDTRQQKYIFPSPPTSSSLASSSFVARDKPRCA
ncbi:glioma pathogenesis protein 1 [Echinococcus multilocularis]|uniref:Glioma pathogenesis protein 1 n=1 Tax=Echinococcus multilocularis TaxID=6211 RepID=A0A068XZD8_ECHMU|nr:glioma pathogenesis protein 1 [Echinococcus multilocularis]